MAGLSCHCTAKALVFASLSNNNKKIIGSSSPQPNLYDNKPEVPSTRTRTRTNTTTTTPTTTTTRHQRRGNKLQQHLKLIQIEQAIGAGSYRDSEPRDSGQRNSTFKGLLPNSAGELEGPVGKKLRETGEWVANKTEGELRLSGKSILMFVFQWIVPAYLFLFLVASGVVKLPFSTPFLDDLIM